MSDALALQTSARSTPPQPRVSAQTMCAESYQGVPGHAPIALWAIPVADLGGVARHVLDVVSTGLPRTRLVVLCPPGPLAEHLREAGQAVLVEPFGPDAGLYASVRSLRHAVTRLRPAVLHTHLAYADFVAALAVPVSSPTRLVSTEHGIAGAGQETVYHPRAWQRRLMEAAHTARCRRFDALIAVSGATAEAMQTRWHLNGIASREVTVIPNGLGYAVRKDKTRQPGLRVLSLSRLSPEKGIEDLLKAFSVLHRDHPEASLTVAGTGPCEGKLRATARSLGLNGAVSFPGYLDAAQALASHHVLAQLSAWENCSYTLLDAAAANIGVVATAVGGNPEILPSHCLVQANDVRGIARTLEQQGLEVDARPGLDGWLTAVHMCEEIVAVYRGCFR